MKLNDTEGKSTKAEDYLFRHLLAMFQTLALQQLGKLTNPMTGKLERDLQQAKITIDMLEMIRSKTSGNLEQDEKKILDTILTDLQMNYVDELGRKEEAEEEAGSEESETVSDKEDTENEGGS